MRVHINDPIDEKSQQQIRDLGIEVTSEHFNEEELKEEIRFITVLVVRSNTKVTKEIMESGRGGVLNLIIRAGVGKDNIDVMTAKELGITVKSTGDASSQSVAELTLGLILALSRHITRANATMHEGEFLKYEFEGEEIYQKTLGLIGFGEIGKRVAKGAKAIGMEILYTNKRGEDKNYEGIYEYAELDELLQRSDYISLHLPSLKGDASLLGVREFDLMKPGVYVINTARGSLIDEESLLHYLNQGKIKAAALDVFKEEPPRDQRLYTHEKILLSPHMGSQTKEAKLRVGKTVVTIVDNFLKAGDRSKE